jgi:hypothetical protein
MRQVPLTNAECTLTEEAAHLRAINLQSLWSICRVQSILLLLLLHRSGCATSFSVLVTPFCSFTSISFITSSLLLLNPSSAYMMAPVSLIATLPLALLIALALSTLVLADPIHVPITRRKPARVLDINKEAVRLRQKYEQSSASSRSINSSRKRRRAALESIPIIDQVSV